MKIELINYSGNRVECEIPEKEEILAAFKNAEDYCWQKGGSK